MAHVLKPLVHNQSLQGVYFLVHRLDQSAVCTWHGTVNIILLLAHLLDASQRFAALLASVTRSNPLN